MKEKSICFVTLGDMRVNASAKRALGLANPMSDLGWRVSIFMADTAENHHQASLFCSNDMIVLFYPEHKNRIFIQRKLKELMPSFVYLTSFNRHTLFRFPSKSKIILEHCELYSKYSDFSKFSNYLALFFEQWSLFRFDGLVMASRYLEKVFNRRKIIFKREKLPMLYLPYAFSEELLLKNDKLSRNDNFTVFVYLGSIRRSYGVFTILEAAKMLKKDTESFKVVLLGGGSDLEEVRAFVDKENLAINVVVKGYVKEEDIPCYFSDADAFLSPMHDTIQDWARCPSKLYMYLPYKKPIITCKIGEPYETLGKEGLYYNPEDVAGLCNCMLKVISGEKVELNIDPDKFSWKSSARTVDLWLQHSFKD